MAQRSPQSGDLLGVYLLSEVGEEIHSVLANAKFRPCTEAARQRCTFCNLDKEIGCLLAIAEEDRLKVQEGKVVYDLGCMEGLRIPLFLISEDPESASDTIRSYSRGKSDSLFPMERGYFLDWWSRVADWLHYAGENFGEPESIGDRTKARDGIVEIICRNYEDYVSQQAKRQEGKERDRFKKIKDRF